MEDNDLYKEALKNLTKKTELEQTLAVGFQGPPQIKIEEKRHYLGEFRERVLKVLTIAQVMRTRIFPEISQALQDQRADKMLIYGDIDYRFRGKYQRLAHKMGKNYTIIHDPELKGPVGLVIASNQAIDVDDIQINE